MQPEVVFVGRSNVGKSSLIRALTGLQVRVGRRPGLTRRILRYPLDGLSIVDMPGFGFMAGLPRKVQEKVKTQIVRYLEGNKEKILFAIEVLDVRAFLEICKRWEKRNQIPVDVEMFYFLDELGLDPILAINKIDIIHPLDRDFILDAICEKLGMLPPWRQWLDIVVPVSARTGEGLKELRALILDRLKRKKAEHLIKCFKKF
ncbi:MAG: GTP-binding protein EngB [Candidatus Hadarchaeales archaeon]